VAGIAAAVLPVLIKAKDWIGLLWIESAVVVVSMILVLVRQKSVRERCVICGSDVQATFMATTIPPSEWQSRYNIRRREGPVCRVCTDLPSDRALKYPWFTKFDELNNEERKCYQCHRIMRASFLNPVPERPDEGVPIRCSFICKYPNSMQCEKLAKKVERKKQGSR